MILVADLSHHRPDVQFENLKAADFKGVITKVSEGLWQDPEFQDYKVEARDHQDFLFGGFHYFRVEVDPIAQANYFWSLAQGLDILAVDVERHNNVGKATPKEFASRLKTFTEYISRLWGQPMWVYTGHYAWVNLCGSYADKWAIKHPLWLAAYNDRPEPPVLRGPWKTITMWQYTSTFAVPGEKRKIDANKFQGSLEDLYAYAKRTVPVAMSLADRIDQLEKQLSTLASRLDKLENLNGI